jgi:hypothetical protein
MTPRHTVVITSAMRSAMHPTLRAVLSLSLSLLAAGAAALASEEAVVSAERAAAMRAQYPYARFSTLSDFEVPALAEDVFKLSPHAATSRKDQILTLPEAVKALAGHNVSVRGYMLPVDLDGGRVTSFLLTSSIDSCHFGMIGQANEWIMVTMAPGRYVPFPKSVPITVFGRLSVAPRMAGGGLSGLYEMTAEAIAIH